MEDGTAPKPLTTKESEPTDTSSNSKSLKDPMVPILMFLGCILATLSIIVAGYFKGNMHIETVWHNLHNFA